MRLNFRTVNTKMSHFQLRHLIKSRSKHQVFYHRDSKIYEWNSLICKNKQHGSTSTIVDLTGKISSIVCMNYCNDILALGGMHSEVVLKSMSKDEILFNAKVSDGPNCISNFIDICDQKHGVWELIVSSNDDCLRIFDANMKLKQQFKFDSCVNHATVSPCGKMILMARDNVVMNIIDKSSGKNILKLEGHADFPFTTSWHPNGYQCASGAQDKTVRIWDIRKGLVHTLGGKMAPIRSVTYNFDGSLLAASEAADFAHIYDTISDYRREQTIDFFGEVSGISFSPCGSTFYLGIHDQTYYGLMEFEKFQHNKIASLVL
jgi:WD40 repeat protein